MTDRKEHMVPTNISSQGELATCPSCTSDDIGVWVLGLTFEYETQKNMEEWHFDVLECNECGQGFVNPIPPEDILSHAYSESYFCYGPYKYDAIGSLKGFLAKYRYSGKFKDHNPGVIASAKRLFAATIEILVGKTFSYSLGIPLHFEKSASILDYGYGSGAWLLSMKKRGYSQLYGYDIAPNTYCKNLLEQQGIRLLEVDPSTWDLASNSFDMIRLEHVLEHLTDPFATLSMLKTYLKPGGLLVMTFPSRSNLTCRYGPHDCDILELPRHLHHHTEDSARCLVQRAGFQIAGFRHGAISERIYAMINRKLDERGLTTLPKAFVYFARPFYGLYCKVVGDSDLFTLLAKNTMQNDEQ